METHIQWSIWGIWVFLPILLVSIVSIKRDKYAPSNIFFAKQRWNCKDILWLLVFLQLFRCISWLLSWKGVITSSQASSYATFLLLVVAAIFLHGVFRSKYELEVSSLGLSLENLIPHVILGLRIAFVFEFVVFFGVLLIGEPQVLLDRFLSFCRIQSFEMALDHQALIFFLTALVLAPIVEEAVFRGFMYSPFRRKVGHKAGVVLTSLVWGIWHSGDIKSVAGVIIMGIVFVHFYVETQSLLPSIVAHSVMNLTLLLTSLYSRLFQNGILSLSSSQFIMLMTMFFLTGFIALSILSRRMALKPHAAGGGT